jgi:D-sedoheptulose 7-phosphate isomerase
MPNAKSIKSAPKKNAATKPPESLWAGNRAYIDTFMAGCEQILRQLDRDSIEGAMDALFRAWQEDRTVFTIGNGGSAGTASHLASDLNKMTALPDCRRMRVMSLVDNICLFSTLVNDDGWENVYTEQLTNFYRPGDMLVAVSVHGGAGKDKAGAWSQNLLKAIQWVKDHGGTTIGLSGFDGGAMKEVCDVCIVVPYNTTPHVEGWHVVLHHLLAFGVAERIAAHAGRRLLRS